MRKYFIISLLSLIFCGCNSIQVQEEISEELSHQIQNGKRIYCTKMLSARSCSMSNLQYRDGRYFGVSGIINDFYNGISKSDLIANIKQIEYIYAKRGDIVNKKLWERYQGDAWNPIIYDPTESVPIDRAYFDSFDPHRRGLAIELGLIKRFCLMSNNFLNKDWVIYEGEFDLTKERDYVPIHLKKDKGRIIILWSPSDDVICEAYVTENGWSYLRLIDNGTDDDFIFDHEPDELVNSVYTAWNRKMKPLIERLIRLGAISGTT